MRRAAGFSVVAFLMLLARPGLAGPFSEVPKGSWAYSACAALVASGVITSSQARSFSGDTLLTRYEFGLSLADPLSRLTAAASDEKLKGKELLDASVAALGVDGANLSNEQLAQIGGNLLRLSAYFEEVLGLFVKNLAPARRACAALADQRALRTWRRSQASSPSPKDLRLSFLETRLEPGKASLGLPFARGRVSLSLGEATAPPIMDLLAVTHPVKVGERLVSASSAGNETPGIADPKVRRLGTSYEYGLGDDLTLSLQYESFARTGRGLAPLDSTTLATLGLGYRLSPSTSIRLRYGILDYANQQLPGATRLRERLAETSISVEF